MRRPLVPSFHSPAPPCHLLLRLMSPTHRLTKGGWRVCGGRKSRRCFFGRPPPSPVEMAARGVTESQRWALMLSLATAEECMARRQRSTSQRHNHLQTALASGLAVEEDLLWGWRENKEQLCKLYGATLWEMPFLFPTGKCAGRCFQRELGADTVPRKACRAELS